MLMWRHSRSCRCKSEGDAGSHYLEESTGGMGSGDGDEAKVGDAKEDSKVGRVVGVCESGEKGRQKDNDETEGRHGRFSN